jgi:hypothetical protein
MAKGTGNLLLQNISGKLGKELVIKQYHNKTVIARYPYIPKQTLTPLKKIYQARFREALKFAREVRSNPQLRKHYEQFLQPGQRLYNYCIGHYLTEVRKKASPLLYHNR